jgi:hypothetical protein
VAIGRDFRPAVLRCVRCGREAPALAILSRDAPFSGAPRIAERARGWLDRLRHDLCLRIPREELMASPISTAHPHVHAGAFLSGRWSHSRWPRLASGVLGAWLAVSAFALEHTFASRVNAFVVGVWIATAALGAAWSLPMRIANTVAAVWLGAATLSMSDVQPATFWNNLALAALVFLLSLIPSPEEPRRVALR